MSRQIVFDTETTGISTADGHRILEIGCVEVIDRKTTGNNFHRYINPQREVDAGALKVHGLRNEDLENEPTFDQVVDEFMEYMSGAELIIHNAAFDVGFVNYELSLLSNNPYGKLEDHCSIIDTLAIARKTYPGARVSLDALCKRFGIDNSHRTLHGALLDAEILFDVYLLMTGGQTSLSLNSQGEGSKDQSAVEALRPLSADRPKLPEYTPSAEELKAHQEFLEKIQKETGECLWLDS